MTSLSCTDRYMCMLTRGLLAPQMNQDKFYEYMIANSKWQTKEVLTAVCSICYAL